jgi:hypothetical protein
MQCLPWSLPMKPRRMLRRPARVSEPLWAPSPTARRQAGNLPSGNSDSSDTSATCVIAAPPCHFTLPVFRNQPPPSPKTSLLLAFTPRRNGDGPKRPCPRCEAVEAGNGRISCARSHIIHAKLVAGMIDGFSGCLPIGIPTQALPRCCVAQFVVVTMWPFVL